MAPSGMNQRFALAEESSAYFRVLLPQEPIMADPRAVPIILSDANRTTLQSWIRRRSAAQGFALRVHKVLACAELGTMNLAIATQLAISNLTVGKW